MNDPLRCEKCGAELESDDAISIIEGICSPCRHRASGPAIDQQRPAHRLPEPQRRPALLAAAPAAQRPPIIDSAPVWGSPRTMRGRRRRRDLVIGAAIGLIVTGSLTAYFLTTNNREVSSPSSGASASPIAMTLTVKPRNARVKLDGREIGPPDEAGQLRFTLPADGEAVRWLEVAAKGFQPSKRPLSVYSGVADVAVELIRAPYELALRTTPPQAEVWINDELKGYSPLTLTMLPADKARLTVKRAGYADIVQELQPPEGGGPLRLDLPLRAAGLTLRVESQPPGAKVTVNGAVKGVSPLSIDLDASAAGTELTLAAALPGYADLSQKFRVPIAPGAEPLVARLDLHALPARVEIMTDPPGGQITIDDRPLGPSPAVAEFAPAEIGRIAVAAATAPGVGRARKEFRVPSPGQLLRLTLPLERKSDRVAFLLLSPTGAGPDHFALLDAVSDQIHRLQPQDQFAVLACSADGIDAWPGGSNTASAASEQKIRAYDMIRALRPSGPGPVADAISAALTTRPATLWIVLGASLNADDLKPLGEGGRDAGPSVNLIVLSYGPQDEWLREWATRHHGTLTLLGQARSPSIAGIGPQDP